MNGHDYAVCGTCGRAWDDGQVSSITPCPGGRVPCEYDHGHPRGRHSLPVWEPGRDGHNGYSGRHL